MSIFLTPFLLLRCRSRQLPVVTLFILAVTIYLRYVSKVNKARNYRDINDGDELKEEPACRRPKMDIWDPAIKKLISVPKPLNCSGSPENFVYVEDGKLMISQTAADKYGDISCDYRPVVRIDDNSQNLGEVVPAVANGTPIASDFFVAECNSRTGVKYRNIHAGIKRKESAIERARAKRIRKDAMRYNVLMFGFDSVSRLNWLRNLPKTYDYFTDILGGVTLEGYNIVGDGTPQALLPILTGKTEVELPEARRGFRGAKSVDGFPWIWRDFADAGYVTQWGEDGASFGTFNLRMLGFDKQPVDHYYRPYQRYAEKIFYPNNTRYCLGSEPRLNVMLKWIRQFFDAYPTLPKFSFLFHSEYTHGPFSTLRLADETLRSFLVNMKALGHLDNTILILMSDHGARFATIRKLLQGKYEERLPYFSVAVPKSFAERYPKAMKNLMHNRKMLAVPFDIHATFKDVISYKDLGAVAAASSRGISLFQKVPIDRTCSDAGIAPHWCACMAWEEVTRTDVHVISAANHVVNAINALTNQVRRSCAELALRTIVRALRYAPNVKLLKFKQSADMHGRVADLSDKMTANSELYQLTVETTPGGALFEATVTHYTLNHTFSFDDKEMSRINKYGNQPHCIQERLPHLRAYCYCKQQIKQSE